MKSNKFFSIFLSILILFVFIASASATDTNSTDTLSTVDNNEILSIENNMNKTIHEKDFISYDEQFNVGNDFTLNNNDLLQQKQMDDEVTILKATPIDTKIIGKDYTLNHKPMPFIVYLKDNNNNPLKDLTVEFTINGVSYSRTTTTDGSAQLNINLGVVGNYPITYAFMGNANYKSTSAKSTIKIVSNKLTPEINANDLTKYHDESSAYKVVLLDNNGNPLVNENIQIKINGVTYTRTTGNNGDATLNINLNEGKYTITTFYDGNSYYNSISKSNIITVNKKTTTLSGDSLTKYYGDNTPYTVKIQDNNKKAISGANIIFIVNGKIYTRTTDNNGIATLNINLNEGKYQINSIFNENDDYKKSTLTKTITINKKTTTLAGSDVVKFYGDDTAYTVQLLDNNKKALANTMITINVNGVDYERTTDANGKVTLNIRLMEGKYTITTKYNGNNYYKVSTLKNTVTVNKKPTTLVGSDVVKFYGDDTVYTVQLLDNNKKALANTLITINVNGVDYERTTDANGKATLNIRLMEGKYTITTKYDGDDYYKSSTTSNIIFVKKYNSILYCNDTNICMPEKDYLSLYLIDEKYKGISNQTILISINDKKHTVKTDNMGCAKLKINYTTGLYNFKATYSGNDYYLNCEIENTLNITSNVFKYSVIIPHYINVSGVWRITDNTWWLDSNYISTGGVSGKIKIPVSRDLDIITKDGENIYGIGFVDNSNHIDYGNSKDLILDEIGLSRIHIESYRDYTNITYINYLTNKINQFSAIYRQKEYNGMHIPDYEEILLVNNGVTQASISFTNPLILDEKGIRAALTWNHFDQNFLSKPYNQLGSYNSLIFSETQEKVNYSDDYQKINCLPSKEKINTIFELNGCTISKDEWISFGKHSSLTDTYELIQTYAIADSLVNNNTIKFYLNNNYTLNKVEKVCYETFLTALSTIWMYDGFVNNLSNYYNVSYGRNNFVVSMCGMEYGNASYIHCPDPLMGISVSGDSWINVYIVKYLSSLMLGEIESAVLNMAGGHCHSSVYEIFSRILNFENFTVLCNENNLTIYLNNDSNYKFIIDLKNGVVYDLSFFNGFTYKGAVSTDFTYCYCYNKISNNLDDLTHEKYVSPYDLNNNNLLTDDEWHAIEDFMSEIALAGSSAATLTVIELILAGSVVFPFILVPVGIAIGLAVVGIALKSDANGGDYGKAVYDSLTSIVLNGI